LVGADAGPRPSRARQTRSRTTARTTITSMAATGDGIVDDEIEQERNEGNGCRGDGDEQDSSPRVGRLDRPIDPAREAQRDGPPARPSDRYDALRTHWGYLLIGKASPSCAAGERGAASAFAVALSSPWPRSCGTAPRPRHPIGMGRCGAAQRRAVVLVYPGASIVVLTWLAGIVLLVVGLVVLPESVVGPSCCPSARTSGCCSTGTGRPLAVLTRGERVVSAVRTDAAQTGGRRITWSRPARLR
jgi:hypothetical protein